MKREQVLKYVGRSVVVNGLRDLACTHKHLVGKQGRLERLTKSGMAEIVVNGQREYVPPSNVDLLPESPPIN